MKNLPTPLITATVFALLFLLERFFPLRKTTRSLIARLLVNLVIAVFTFIAAVGLVQPAARWALTRLGWSAGKGFGLVHLVALPAPLEFALSFLLMDLAFYYWHVANLTSSPLF
jgi:sterol desaturase/sphingolipid hydroxylase (fatty acid hydroxylase superfamily)